MFCKDAVAKYKSRLNKRRGETLAFTAVTIFGLLVLLVTCALALIYMTLCPSKRHLFNLVEHNGDVSNFTHIRIINQTPQGSTKLMTKSTRASTTSFEAIFKNYGMNKQNRLGLSKFSSRQPGFALFHSASIAVSSVLGYDATCENVDQAFKLEAGTGFNGSVEILAGNGDASVYIVGKEQFDPWRKKGMYLKNLYINCSNGVVDVSKLSGLEVLIRADLAVYRYPIPPAVTVRDLITSNMTLYTRDRDILVDSLVLYDGGFANISSSTGNIILKNAGEGDGDVHVFAEYGNVEVHVKCLYAGAYNVQAGQGIIYMRTTTCIHLPGPSCSNKKWSTLPALYQGVGVLHYHCFQGYLGYKYGRSKILIYAKTGDVTFVASDP